MKESSAERFASQAVTCMHRRADHLQQEIGALCKRYIRASLRYVGEFWTLRCGPDLLALNVYPNVKEVTETMGAYNAARRHLHDAGWSLQDRDIVAVFPGDGSTPRTAAMFAMRTGWICHSIDPRLKESVRYHQVRRLHVWPHPIEEVNIEEARVLVVAVHAHVKLPVVLEHVKGKQRAVISIPCCVPQDLDQPPDVEYEDRGILSPQATVRIWRDV